MKTVDTLVFIGQVCKNHTGNLSPADIVSQVVKNNTKHADTIRHRTDFSVYKLSV